MLRSVCPDGKVPQPPAGSRDRDGVLRRDVSNTESPKIAAVRVTPLDKLLGVGTLGIAIHEISEVEHFHARTAPWDPSQRNVVIEGDKLSYEGGVFRVRCNGVVEIKVPRCCWDARCAVENGAGRSKPGAVDKKTRVKT